MTHRDSLITALVSRDPLDQAFGALRDLVTQTSATGGAVLAQGEGGPTEWLSLNARTASAVMKNWKRYVRDLSVAGARTASNGITTALIRDEGAIIGLLVLEGASGFDMERYSGYLLAFTVAIKACAAPADDPPISSLLRERYSVSDPETKRTAMFFIRRFEGNLARVAREMAVSRRTIYQWLERWGVPRPEKP